MKAESDVFYSLEDIRSVLRQLYLEDVKQNTPAKFEDLRAVEAIKKLPPGKYVSEVEYRKLQRQLKSARPAVDIQWIPVGGGLIWALECSNCGYRSHDLKAVPNFCPRCGGAYVGEGADG